MVRDFQLAKSFIPVVPKGQQVCTAALLQPDHSFQPGSIPEKAVLLAILLGKNRKEIKTAPSFKYDCYPKNIRLIGKNLENYDFLKRYTSPKLALEVIKISEVSWIFSHKKMPKIC